MKRSNESIRNLNNEARKALAIGLVSITSLMSSPVVALAGSKSPEFKGSTAPSTLKELGKGTLREIEKKHPSPYLKNSVLYIRESNQSHKDSQRAVTKENYREIPNPLIIQIDASTNGDSSPSDFLYGYIEKSHDKATRVVFVRFNPYTMKLDAEGAQVDSVVFGLNKEGQPLLNEGFNIVQGKEVPILTADHTPLPIARMLEVSPR